MKKKAFASLCIALAMLLCACAAHKSAATQIQSNMDSITTPEIVIAEPSEQPEEAAASGDSTEQQVEEILTDFAAAYLSGDRERITSFLVEDYKEEEIPYPYNGEEAVLSQINGIELFAENLTTTGTCTASIPFKKDASADYFIYLTVELVQADDGLKIQFYGLEG